MNLVRNPSDTTKRKKISAKIKYILKLIAAILISLHLAFLIITGIYLLYYKTNHPEVTSIMHYRRQKSGENPVSPSFIHLEDIPVDIISCVIFIEDFNFYNHYGIDIESIRYAIRINRKLGYFAYGGSTLTQQLARTLFLNPEKNLFRKYLEILAALEMEILLGKERILELYFNYAEWGHNVFGINNASLYHFDKLPVDLEEKEKLQLVTLLASPIVYNPLTLKQNKMLAKRFNSICTFYNEMKKAYPRVKSIIREKK